MALYEPMRSFSDFVENSIAENLYDDEWVVYLKDRSMEFRAIIAVTELEAKEVTWDYLIQIAEVAEMAREQDELEQRDGINYIYDTFSEN